MQPRNLDPTARVKPSWSLKTTPRSVPCESLIEASMLAFIVPLSGALQCWVGAGIGTLTVARYGFMLEFGLCISDAWRTTVWGGVLLASNNQRFLIFQIAQVRENSQGRPSFGRLVIIASSQLLKSSTSASSMWRPRG